MHRLKTVSVVFFGVCFSILMMSWMSDEKHAVGPIPTAPDYDDPSQWYIVDRKADADLFYIISTETDDHLVGNDTCHFADTYDKYLRGRMMHEMHAVDSFYSGRLNYFSPYYRQLSMQSWTDEEMVKLRLPLAMKDCVDCWDYYIKHFNRGRPFVLAGFSQGAHAMTEILKRMPDSIAERMIAAYYIGYKVTSEDTAACRHLRPASGAIDTRVAICFNSVRTPESEISVLSGGNVFCINPVNWRTDTTSTKFVFYGKKKNDTLSVRLDPKSRLLLIDGYKDNRPMPVIGIPGNYHHMELKFFYPYIQKNIADRVASFKEEKQNSNVTKIACIGNSITAGFGIKYPSIHGYPPQLQQMLGSNYWVRNFGVSSRTMLNKGDYPYMNESAWKEALDFKPDIAIVKLGTNDSKPENWQYGKGFKKDLEQMVTTLRESNPSIKIFLCTPIPAFKPTWNISDDVILNKIIPIQHKVAKKYGLQVIDLHTLYAGDGDKMLKDGIHPDERGTKRLAEIIAEALR